MSLIWYVAYDVGRLIKFVAYEVGQHMMFVGYDVCHITFDECGI